MKTGHIFTPIILLLLLCTASCMAPARLPFNDSQRIHSFPTKAYSKQPLLIFPGEDPPEKPYIRTHILEVRGGINAAYAELVESMRYRGYEAGVDAVIIMGKEEQQHWESTKSTLELIAEIITQEPVDDNYQLVEASVLTGLGVIFKENVDYLHNYRYLNQLHQYNQEKDTFELIANLYPDFDNRIMEVECLGEGKGDHYYRNFIHRYSDEFLLEEKSYLWRERYKSNGMLTRRKYTGANEQINLKLTYNPVTMKLQQLQAKFLMGSGIRQDKVLYYTYDESGKLTEKRIFENDLLSLREELIYDEWDRLITSKWHITNNEKETPFLKVEYYYYDNQDIYEVFE